ncbi:uncharacterized protein LOC115080809 isoform X2 [Rhinatrema bivittatum]|nr:uncharacterized protein LOC115080809 isoform X2 [Rhinatrema bivittatum]
MVLDLNSSAFGSKLNNFSALLVLAQRDRGGKMEDAPYQRMVAFSMVLGWHPGGLPMSKLLWQAVHYWIVLAGLWLWRILKLNPSLSWHRLVDDCKGQGQEQAKGHPPFLSCIDPEDSAGQRDCSGCETMATEKNSPWKKHISGGREDPGEMRYPCLMDSEDKGEDLVEGIGFQLPHPTMLSLINCCDSKEDHQRLSIEEDSPNSPVMGSALSDTESTWSDEEDPEESWAIDDENRALWDFFCHSEDPYNPLSFSRATRSQPAPPAQGEIQQEEAERAVEQPTPLMILAQSESESSEPAAEMGDWNSQRSRDSSISLKKVRFSPVVLVRQMRTWSFAHHMARKGPWEEIARDRCRFQRHIAEMETTIGWCLESGHREAIQARGRRGCHTKEEVGCVSPTLQETPGATEARYGGVCSRLTALEVTTQRQPKGQRA